MTDTKPEEYKVKVIELVFDERGRFQGVRERGGFFQKIKLEVGPSVALNNKLDDPAPPIPPDPPPANKVGECSQRIDILIDNQSVAHLKKR